MSAIVEKQSRPGGRSQAAGSSAADSSVVVDAGELMVGGVPAGYAAGPVKRLRSTKAQVTARRDALVEIVRESAPTGVRFTYYRAVAKGIVAKSQAGYDRVQRDLQILREQGEIDWSMIVDSTRWMRKPESFDSVADALEATAKFYRRNLWTDSDVKLEVWCESESVAGVLYPVTSAWDVPLYPVKGQTSSSFAWGAAQTYRNDPRRLLCLYVGDHDPAGYEIQTHLARKLQEFSGRGDLQVTRLACLSEQVSAMGLAGTPPKKNTYRNALTDHVVQFAGPAVEVEAIDPPVLRGLLEDAIRARVDDRRLGNLLQFERSEQQLLRLMARSA